MKKIIEIVGRLADRMNSIIDVFENWVNNKYPPKFDFRYNKVTGEFLTVPAKELESWDKKYLKDCKKAKIKP